MDSYWSFWQWYERDLFQEDNLCNSIIISLRGKKKQPQIWDFPSSPVDKTLPSSAGGMGLMPGQGFKIPHASRPKERNIKQKQCCNKFNKDFKNGSHQKKKKKRKKEKKEQICSETLWLWVAQFRFT